MRWRYWSLLVSLSALLHMALFWPSPESDVRRSAAPALSVRLPPLQVPADTHRIVADATDRQIEMTSVEAEGPKQAVVDQPPPSSTSESVLEARRRFSSSEGAVQAPQALPPVMRQPGAVPHMPEQAPSSASIESEGARAQSLSRYRIALAVAAVRLQALEGEVAGVTGTAVVDVRLGGGGPQVRLATSSGVERLDRQALALLGRAVRLVPAPTGDALSDATVRLPVVFSTDDS